MVVLVSCWFCFSSCVQNIVISVNWSLALATCIPTEMQNQQGGNEISHNLSRQKRPGPSQLLNMIQKEKRTTGVHPSSVITRTSSQRGLLCFRHKESDSLLYLALYVWLADGITQPIIQEQHPSTSVTFSAPPVDQHQQEHERGSSEKAQKHSQPLCPWCGTAHPWGRSVWRSRDPPARGQRCWASCHLLPQTDQTDVRVTTENCNPFPATALSASQQAALWQQLFCSCHSHATSTDRLTYYGIPYNFSAFVIFTELIPTDWHIMEYPTTFLLLSQLRN